MTMMWKEQEFQTSRLVDESIQALGRGAAYGLGARKQQVPQVGRGALGSIGGLLHLRNPVLKETG